MDYLMLISQNIGRKNNIDFDQFIRVLLAKHVEMYNTERTKKKEKCARLDAKPLSVEKNTLFFVFPFLDHLHLSTNIRAPLSHLSLGHGETWLQVTY